MNTAIVKKGNKIDVLEVGKYYFNIPSEANIKNKKKVNVAYFKDGEKIPEKSNLILFCTVFRKNKEFCLGSAGGLICRIPPDFEIDENIIVTID